MSSSTSMSTDPLSSPTTRGCSSHVAWVETVTGLIPNSVYGPHSALEHIDPKLMRPTHQNNPNGHIESNPSHITRVLSPRAQREVERLDQYFRLRKSKREMRRIIKVIQDKRRNEFCFLREALHQVYHYNGPYLQKPGEKEAAANLIRVSSLGKEFAYDFDHVAKWLWLQIRVDAL
ncbi:hypothetical protein DFH28DRAFT_932436 [Melampsora americana]|nr:hypothetical protein DFH28DRAFT_932436 [Melampsora americana]